MMGDRYYSIRLNDGAGNEVDPMVLVAMEDQHAAQSALARALVTHPSETREVRSVEAVAFEWVYYAPDGVDPDDFDTSAYHGLRHFFFTGGRIGVLAAGLEVMFTPDLLVEPAPRDPDGTPDEDGYVEETLGFAKAKVRGRPDLAFDVDLDTLDESHLLDRLQGETAMLVARMRRIDERIDTGVTAALQR